MADGSAVSSFPESSSPSKCKTPAWLEELGWAETYEIIELAGWGGVGRVYKAWHRGLRACAALKLIDPSRVDDNQVLARFETEARTLAQLQEPVPHPNIVRVIDFKLTASVGCLVMAYVPGLNLRSWCLRQKLDFRQRAALLAKAARAAGFMHQCGVVHRDLKPANILVHEDTHEPVIVDLGVVKTNSSVTMTLPDQAVGTMHYMAPEQLSSSCGAVTPRADVFALGTILYELMTGILPHSGTLSEIAHRHQQEVAPARPSTLAKALPRDLEIICLKALSHRPEERYASGTELADDIERYLQGERILARPLSWTAIAWRHARRHPALTAALLSCLALGSFALARHQAMLREREAAQIEMTINAGLLAKPWQAADFQRLLESVRDLSRLNSSRAAEWRVVLRDNGLQALRAKLGQPRLAPEDYTQIGESITWLEHHHGIQGTRLRSLLAEREASWQPIVDLKPPFEDISDVFLDPKSLSADAQALTPIYAQEKPPTPRIHLRPGGSRVDICATFLPQSKNVTHVGFCITAKGIRYYFRLLKSDGLRGADLANVEEAQRPGRTAILSIAREEEVLRASAVFIPDVLRNPVRITARMDQGELSCGINDSTHIEFRDVFAPAAPLNLALDWPENVRLQSLQIRTKSLPAGATPLELADELATRGSWRDAERIYQSLAHHTTFGTEASYKRGECHHALGQEEEALKCWHRAALGQVAPWQDLAVFALWRHHVLAGELDLARPHFELLSSRGSLTGRVRQVITKQNMDDFTRAYRSTGRGLNLLRPNANIEVAARVHEFLGFTPLDVAVRFGLARHSNGSDDLARSQFHKALGDLSPEKASPSDREKALLAFNVWLWMEPSEKEPWLANLWQRWLNSNEIDTASRNFLLLEQVRRTGRNGTPMQAAAMAAPLRTSSFSDERTRVSACLLEASHLFPSAPEEARRILRETAHSLAPTRRAPAIPDLCDRLVLMSAAGTWTGTALADALGNVISSAFHGPSAEVLQSQFTGLLLEDPAFVDAANLLCSDEAGMTFLRDYSLRSRPAREMTRRALELFLCRYLLHREPSAPRDMQQGVQDLVNAVLTEFSEGRFREQDLFLLLQCWREPAFSRLAGIAMQSWSPSLRQKLEWLLNARNENMTASAEADDA